MSVAEKPPLLISACLLGFNCKYNGNNNYCEKAELLSRQWELIPVCPEQLGGLSTPRTPAERTADKVVSKTGMDVTQQYQLGAEIALETALSAGCRIALMKARSPSCGYGQIYDGTFSGHIISGNGVTTDLLLSNNFKVYTEESIDTLQMNTACDSI